MKKKYSIILLAWKWAEFVCAVIVLMLAVNRAAGEALENGSAPMARQVLVIDPGHGGNDVGATGTTGLQEKNVTLKLARKMAERLQDRYRVVLTRTDDDWLDQSNRISMANHEKADLFVSLHVSGSPSRGVNGMTFAYYQDVATTQLNERKVESEEHVVPWDVQQLPYQSAGKALASLLQGRFSTYSEHSTVEVKGLPIALFAGAGMPSVWIEIGYITNPIEEEHMADPTYLDGLSKEISDVIAMYLGKSTGSR